MKSDRCNRNDIAAQPIYIYWHVLPVGISVHMLQKLQVFLLQTGHEPESFPDKIIIFASMKTEHLDSESPR